MSGSTARVKMVDANTTRPAILRVMGMAGLSNVLLEMRYGFRSPQRVGATRRPMINSASCGTGGPGLRHRAALRADPLASSGLRLRGSLGQSVELHQVAKQLFHLLERHHVRSVRGGVVGVLVGLDKNPGDADCHRGAREHRNKFPLAPRCGPLPA